jgi:hypothetical protein
MRHIAMIQHIAHGMGHLAIMGHIAMGRRMSAGRLVRIAMGHIAVIFRGRIMTAGRSISLGRAMGHIAWSTRQMGHAGRLVVRIAIARIPYALVRIAVGGNMGHAGIRMVVRRMVRIASMRHIAIAGNLARLRVRTEWLRNAMILLSARRFWGMGHIAISINMINARHIAFAITRYRGHAAMGHISR